MRYLPGCTYVVHYRRQNDDPQWWDYDSTNYIDRAIGGRRLPVLRPAVVHWNISTAMLVHVLSESSLLEGVERMKLLAFNYEDLYIALWPRESPGTMWSSQQTVGRPSASCYFEEKSGMADLANRENVGADTWPQHRVRCELSHTCVDETGFRWVDLEDASKSCLEKSLRHISWPASIRELTLGWDTIVYIRGLKSHCVPCRFPPGDILDHLLLLIVWPTSLLKLTFGDDVNHTIVGVRWPAGLLELTFGARFDQPIVDIVWPPSLLELSFGRNFNQPVVDVVWPVALLELTFGDFVNQPINGLRFPSSILKVTFGNYFNRSIESVTWPTSLLELSFGSRLDQPFGRVVWPVSLPCLTWGCLAFKHPIAEVTWPLSLLRIIFVDTFGQPVAELNYPATEGRLLKGFEETFNHPFDGKPLTRHVSR